MDIVAKAWKLYKRAKSRGLGKSELGKHGLGDPNPWKSPTKMNGWVRVQKTIQILVVGLFLSMSCHAATTTNLAIEKGIEGQVDWFNSLWVPAWDAVDAAFTTFGINLTVSTQTKLGGLAILGNVSIGLSPVDDNAKLLVKNIGDNTYIKVVARNVSNDSAVQFNDGTNNNWYVGMLGGGGVSNNFSLNQNGGLAGMVVTISTAGNVSIGSSTVDDNAKLLVRGTSGNIYTKIVSSATNFDSAVQFNDGSNNNWYAGVLGGGGVSNKFSVNYNGGLSGMKLSIDEFGTVRLAQQSNCETKTPGAVGELCVQDSATCPITISTGTSLAAFSCLSLTAP